jgi:hypothetical protein
MHVQDYSLLVVVDNDSKLIHCGIIGTQQHQLPPLPFFFGTSRVTLKITSENSLGTRDWKQLAKVAAPAPNLLHSPPSPSIRYAGTFTRSQPTILPPNECRPFFRAKKYLLFI